MPEDLQAEFKALRERRKRILQLQTERSAVATAARELLAQESTWPRKRAEVEAELRTAEVFDLPMLAEELALTDQAITKLAASLQPEPPLAILAQHGEPDSALEKLDQQIDRLGADVKRLEAERPGCVTSAHEGSGHAQGT